MAVYVRVYFKLPYTRYIFDGIFCPVYFVWYILSGIYIYIYIYICIYILFGMFCPGTFCLVYFVLYVLYGYVLSGIFCLSIFCPCIFCPGLFCPGIFYSSPVPFLTDLGNDLGQYPMTICFFSRMLRPEPSVSWTKDGNRVDAHAEKGKYELKPADVNTELLIKNVHSSDAGRYLCRAENGFNPPATRAIDVLRKSLSSVAF